MASANVELVRSYVERRGGEALDVVDGGERIAVRVRIGGDAGPERIVGEVHDVRDGEFVGSRTFEQVAAALEEIGVEGLRRDECPIEVLRACYDAFNRHDADAFLALQHDEAELMPLRAAVEGNVARGKDELRDMLFELWDAWDEQALEPVELYARGGALVVAAAMTARGPGSGALIRQRIGQTMRFRDGKAYSIRSYPTLDQAITAATAD